MSKTGIRLAVFGFTTNFLLFLIKLYIGISSCSLAIYCDSINNLGDTLSCIIALVGFVIMRKLDDKRSNRIQALATFVIGLMLAVTGAYFTYNGVGRLMYPIPISYQKSYALLIAGTIAVKLIMGIIYSAINRRKSSPVFRTLIIDSFLDCAITLSALLSLTLAPKMNFAIDSIISIVIGAIVCVSAVKTVIEQSKFLIND